MFPEHILKFKPRKRSKKQIRERHRREKLDEIKRIWFNLQLLSDGEIPIKENNVVALISLLDGRKFTVSQVCHHFDNKQYWTCSYLQRCYFFVRRKLECAKIYLTSYKQLQNVMQPPIFGCTKRYDQHPICTNPPPLINDRSLNTPHQRHYIQAAC